MLLAATNRLASSCAPGASSRDHLSARGRAAGQVVGKYPVRSIDRCDDTLATICEHRRHCGLSQVPCCLSDGEDSHPGCVLGPCRTSANASGQGRQHVTGWGPSNSTLFRSMSGRQPYCLLIPAS